MNTEGIVLYKIDCEVEEILPPHIIDFDSQKKPTASDHSLDDVEPVKEEERRTVTYREEEEEKEAERIIEHRYGALQVSFRNENWNNSSGEPSCYSSSESLNSPVAKRRKALPSNDLRSRLNSIRFSPYKRKNTGQWKSPKL